MVKGRKWEELKHNWCRQLGAGNEIVGWLAPATAAFQTLLTWLRNRPPVWSRITRIDRVNPRHFEDHDWKKDGSDWASDADSHWWRIPVSAAELAGRTVGWHATSMYCLQRIVHENGPQEGFAENTQSGKTVKGVFYMHGPQAHCCENYLHHVMLDDDGWLFAPLLQLYVDEELMRSKFGTTQTLRRGQKQRIAKKECVDLAAVYIHMVHISQVVLKPAACETLAEPGFHPLLEIDPYENWQSICARSQERQFVTLV